MNWLVNVAFTCAVWFLMAAGVGTFARVAWAVFVWWGPA